MLISFQKYHPLLRLLLTFLAMEKKTRRLELHPSRRLDSIPLPLRVLE